jgi:PiT family inorganic phosphate transporter
LTEPVIFAHSVRGSRAKELVVAYGVVLAVAAGVALAYVNGANDVSKGIATLVGSGVTDYRRAILWGSFCTGLGGLAGAIFATAMVGTFGRGLLSQNTVPTWAAALATIIGSTAWVAIATRTGLPVSTTHAIVGSIAGVGTVAYGLHGLQWTSLAGRIAVPLMVSPLVGLALTYLGTRLLKPQQMHEGSRLADCVCADIEAAPALLQSTSAQTVLLSTMPSPTLRIEVASQETCSAKQPHLIAVTLSHLHWFTSGATSFARGLNDAPKVVAIVLAAIALSGTKTNLRVAVFVLVTAAMVAGSLMAGRRVTSVLAEKVTKMNDQEGFLANLITAALVGPGAALGLPMSTTHVSSGTIVGLGLQRKSGLNWKVVREMLLAWIVTLPLAALLGIVAYFLLRAGHI